MRFSTTQFMAFLRLIKSLIKPSEYDRDYLTHTFYATYENFACSLDEIESLSSTIAQKTSRINNLLSDIRHLSTSTLYQKLESDKNFADFFKALAKLTQEAIDYQKELRQELHTEAATYCTLEGKPLSIFLQEKGIDEAIANEICEMLASLGYTDTVLSNIDAALSESGRLFLNNVFRECQKRSLDTRNLAALAAALEIKEALSPPLAHFIWVGPPTETDKELIGVRSLAETKKDQPIYFWILAAHVDHYQQKTKTLRLTNVHLIAIEAYAKKMQMEHKLISSNRQISLEQCIEHFKAKIAEKITLADQCEAANPKKALYRTLAIRDRVTIVDHVKSLIPKWEGGWIFDADIILSSQYNHFQSVLPSFSRWLFFKVGSSPDVWSLFCDRTSTWDGNPSFVPLRDKALEREENVQRIRKGRALLLERYIDATFADDDFNSLDKLGADDLQRVISLRSKNYGEAIMELEGMTVGRSGRLGGSALQLFYYHCISNIYLVPFRPDWEGFALTAFDDFFIFKKYNGSYKTAVSSSFSTSLFAALSPEVCQKFLIARKFYIQDDLYACFPEISVQKEVVKREGYKIQNMINLHNVSILHLAIIFRPQFFPFILAVLLSALEEEKIGVLEALLDAEIVFPAQLFCKDEVSETLTQTHTLLTLSEKLKELPEITDNDRAFLAKVGGYLQEAKEACRAFRMIPSPTKKLNGYELMKLLLTQENVDSTLRTYKTDLPNIVQTPHQLCSLLSITHLTSGERTLLLEGLRGRLPEFTEDLTDFYNLIALSTLTEMQRKYIMYAYFGRDENAEDNNAMDTGVVGQVMKHGDSMFLPGRAKLLHNLKTSTSHAERYGATQHKRI